MRPWPMDDWAVFAFAPRLHGRRDGVLRRTGISPPDHDLLARTIN